MIKEFKKTILEFSLCFVYGKNHKWIYFSFLPSIKYEFNRPISDSHTILFHFMFFYFKIKIFTNKKYAEKKKRLHDR